eukprot:7150731-Prymnesium_polylepis.1
MGWWRRRAHGHGRRRCRPRSDSGDRACQWRPRKRRGRCDARRRRAWMDRLASAVVLPPRLWIAAAAAATATTTTAVAVA